MVHEKTNIRVLPDDTDAFGRLNWLAYARYCEEGEAGLMEMLGFSPTYFYKRFKISFPRRTAIFEYLSPVSPYSFMGLETEVEKVDKTPLTLSHTFYKKNHEEDERILAAKAQITIVAFDRQTNQKTDLPFQMTDSLRRFNVKIGV
jgi:acyl-CoA thioesterase FadM